MFGLGPIELVVVLLILLMVFGARRLPEMGRQLGSGMREFKEGIVNPVQEVKQEVTRPIAEEERPTKRTAPGLPRPAEAEAGGASQMRDAVPD